MPGTCVLRDAVHGDMEFARDVEMETIDTSLVQRLRGIRQLGTASLVYPTAVHTRFDHSLGTAWMARRILDRLRATGASIDRQEYLAVIISALLHDVTHIPFGHTFEDERRLFERHDTVGRFQQFLGDEAVASLLDREQLTDTVLGILTGSTTHSHASWQRDIVCGTICADLLDYLARDNYFCGLSQGYDDRLFRYFALHEGGLVFHASKGGEIREDALSEIIHLLRIRYFLTERVYFHHTKTATGAMISKAVELAMRQGLQLEDLFPMRDETLMETLRTRYAPNDPALDRLLVGLDSRQVYKRAYLLDRSVGEDVQQDLIGRYHADRIERENLEEELAAATGLEAGELIVYCPAAKMSLKEAEVRVLVSGGAPVPLSSLQIPEVDSLAAKHRNLWRFYVFVAARHSSDLKRVGEVIQGRLGYPNQLHGRRPRPWSSGTSERKSQG